VTYRIKELKATLKIYSTGSITVNGKEIPGEIRKINLLVYHKMYSLNCILSTAPSEAIVQLAIEHIYPLILPFKLKKLIRR